VGESERVVRLLLATAFFTGLSSFIYEIVWIRMLSLVLGASTHSFELMLASFILGLALGGLWIRNRVDQLGDPVRFLGYVQLAMGVAAAATVAFYVGSFDFMAWLLSALARSDGGFVFFNLSSTLIALLVMLPATFCAGMTLPLITYRLLHSRQGERALGTVYAVNTLGSIAGVIIAVHLLMVWLGVHGALLFGAAIDVALGIFLLCFGVGPQARRSALRGPVLAAVACLVIVGVAFKIDPSRSASGVFRTGAARLAPSVKLPFYKDGKTASVSVLEQDGLVGIRTNGKPDASLELNQGRPPTRDEFTMTLLGVLPMGHAPEAKTAAVIGFGSGMSTAILLASPRFERVDTIEIEPAMVEGAQHFRPLVDAAFTDPRSHIVIDDAKSYFARGRAKYDIIVSEPSNPWVSGVASLFTEEFYARLNTYMNEGGVLSQWLHTYEMDSTTLASIFAAVSKTFPEFVVYSTIDADIVLIARKGGPPGELDPSVLKIAGLQPILRRLKMVDPDVVLRRKVASSQMLMPMFARFLAPTNSDYFPFVEQRASKTRFTQARVAELSELSGAPIPMLEMLGGAPQPSAQRHDVIPATLLDVAVNEAWTVRDGILGGRAGLPPSVIVEPRELSARLVLQWADGCSPTLTFDQILPAMVSVAETTVPFLNPQVGTAVWKRLRDTRCGRAVNQQQARWLDLFEAASRRDSAVMAETGMEILRGTRGLRNPASEFVFLATATALVCRGDHAHARALLETSHEWMRPSVRATELHLLRSLSRSAGAPALCAPKAP
jgi:predicted membrane-bound spermidine synthase